MAKGFNSPRSPRSGGNMMAQLAKLQEQMAAAQEEIAQARITESAGGAVTVTMSGDQKCLEVKIQAEVLEDADVEMLQDLLLTAINKALESARALSEEKMAPFTSMLGGMGLG
ncbi:MAG TPA: YbaB/EbfC family nucleoid-associated protein [Anaerolineaceae bacterium]|nr:MAG: Nucleoid-associated protein0 [Anaerolineae bacterium 49_20]HAE85455.1 YbaB/EbfC family nucleoid-associated protein [Anaerolineaceae bacterium]